MIRIVKVIPQDGLVWHKSPWTCAPWWDAEVKVAYEGPCNTGALTFKGRKASLQFRGSRVLLRVEGEEWPPNVEIADVIERQEEP